MKWCLRVLLWLLTSLPAIAHTELRGLAAKDLYELMPGSIVDANGMYPGLRCIKVAGEVTCSERVDDSCKCLLPNKSSDDRVWLNRETSQLFFDALSAKGYSASLGLSGSITCTLVSQDSLPGTTYPSCSITP